MPDPVADHIALVGLMGSGKTSVGRTLARQLERPFVDLDKVIVRDGGRSIAEIFEHDGEDAFRSIESDRLASVLAADEPIVLATGGGVVVRVGNVERLHSLTTVVWLRGTPETLARRVGDGAGRPLLATGDGGESMVDRLRRLSDERVAAYRTSAHVTVDVDGRTRDQIVEAILAELETR